MPYGFTLTREALIAEYRITARLYIHDRTGAELLSMVNDDTNKVFGITFRTPPDDSTGVAHILEHSVLCGSTKYPTKEPFVELMKGSLQTFLNAFTYPDKTCYPVASQNLQDFYNLVDVYMDAALHPLLHRHTHEQEAWHYEADSVDAPPVFKGVVFNEMKGVYAAADNILEEFGKRVLFPDTTYGVDYGGDPRHIPDLTWEQLRAFHAAYYHPSNARIFFYGDDPEDERLRRMDAYLRDYDRAEINSAVAVQPARPLPERVVMPYPSQPDDTNAGHYLTINWRLREDKDPEYLLAWSLLEYILIETPASPLRKALMDADLGDDLAGSGVETHVRELYFSTGLKGFAPADEEKVVDVMFTTLRELVQHGIDPKTIDAALNTEEFHLRELNTGNYPRGLSLMVAALQTWVYGGDPLGPIQYARSLAAIRARLAAGERYFESLIQRELLDNPNRVRLVLAPDPDLKNRLDREEQERLARAHAGWSAEQRRAVVERTAELRRLQATPDRPEELACIPNLARSDLDSAASRLPIETGSIADTPFLFHDLFTQGITYLDLGFNLAAVPDHLLSLVPVWSRAVLETGTAAEDFVALSQRIGQTTGGIDPELLATTRRQTPDPVTWLFLRGKAMDDQLHHLLAILHDILDGARLDLRERVAQIVSEEKAELESSIIPSGHRFVAQRLRARYTEADAVQEQLSGISYLLALRNLERRIGDEWPKVAADLHAVHAALVNRQAMLVNVTASGTTRAATEKAIATFLARLPATTWSPHRRILPPAPHAPEGLLIPAQVNYVGKSVNLYQLQRPITGHDLVVNRYLRTAWLWDQVRVQGGAYGAFGMLDPRAGQCTMTSYRDPNTERTLATYDRTPEFLRALSLDDAELTRAIVGTIGDLDGYLLPDAKGFIAMGRHLAGDTDAIRQTTRDQVLATTAGHFAEYAASLDLLARHGSVVMMGAREKLGSHPGITLIPVL
ncbi:MAG TPA: insulinase family protein [Kiritimatiellia bacterium]|nr:insulinase family protein [Kiritimatiellia bacterium]HMP35258.1 insulinase family protein [Kiritimatiellia bacterium]